LKPATQFHNVSDLTVCVSKKLDRYEHSILAQLDKTFFNLKKISQIICVQ